MLVSGSVLRGRLGVWTVAHMGIIWGLLLRPGDKIGIVGGNGRGKHAAKTWMDSTRLRFRIEGLYTLNPKPRVT